MSYMNRPREALKGFKRVLLLPGETKTVSIPLNRNAFAYYDPAQSGWVAQPDNYEILVGSSSRDIRLHDHFKLTESKP